MDGRVQQFEARQGKVFPKQVGHCKQNEGFGPGEGLDDYCGSPACDANGCTRRGIRVTFGLLAMPAATASPITSLAPAAEIARAEGRRPVGVGEDQLIIGYLGRTANVHDRIVELMTAQGVTWTMMAKELGCSRQALVASLKRRHVQLPRFRAVCRLLGHELYPGVLVDTEYDIRANWDMI